MDVPKEIYYINFKVQLVTFRVVRLLSVLLFQRSCQRLKKLWKSSFVNAHKRSLVAASISGIVSKRFPFTVNLIFGNSQKSQCAKSCEYGG
jgi:hypothetical protein